ARGREYVQYLIFRHVAAIVIAARHAQVSEDELRKEREIESDEHNQRRQSCPALGIELAGNLGPPEMHSSEISDDRAPDHEVVKVGDDEIGVGHVHVDA